MFNFEESLRSAEARLTRPAGRRRRADSGRSRLRPEVVKVLEDATRGDERPSMATLRRRVEQASARLGVRPPCRTTLYAALDRLEGSVSRVSELPTHVAACLHNLAPGTEVPGRQVVFACLNYGSLPALSFAAGMMWLDLYQARRLRGWRPRSRGLLDAILRRRDRR